MIAKPDLAYTQLLAPFIIAGVGVSMAIPAAQNSVVGSVANEAIGKAAHDPAPKAPHLRDQDVQPEYLLVESLRCACRQANAHP